MRRKRVNTDQRASQTPLAETGRTLTLPRHLRARLLGKLPFEMIATMGANVGVQVGGLLSALLVARLLGPGPRGELAGAIAWCALIAAIMDLGISQSLPFYCARHTERPGPFIGTGLAYAVSIGICGMAIGFGIAHFILGPRNAPMAQALIAYLLYIPTYLVGTYMASAAQGLGLIRLFNRIRLANGFAYPVTMIVLIAGGARQISVILAICSIAQLTIALTSIVALHRHTTAEDWRPSGHSFRHMIGYGSRTHLGNLAWLANGKLDQMILSASVSSALLGIYANAAAYSSVLFAAASGIGMASFSAIASAQTPRAALDNFDVAWRRSLRTLIIGGPLLAVAAPILIPLAFTAKFTPAILPAIILVAGSALLTLNYVLSLTLRAEGLPLYPSYGEGVGLIVSAVGLTLLLPYFGIVGAAMVSVISYAATLILLMLMQKRYRMRIGVSETQGVAA